MVVLRNIAIPAAALASVALGAPSRMSSLRRDDDPLGSKLPSGFDRGECTANDFSSDDSRKSVWETARGSELIDAYLNQNSRDDWATTILKTLFPEDGNSFDCWTSESTCDTNSHTCSEFSDRGAAGFYEVYIALEKFHTFVAQYLEDLQDSCASLERQLFSVAQEFKRDEADEPPNAGAIIAGLLSIGAGVASGNPPAAGALGAMSGFASIAGELFQSESNIPDLLESEASLQAGLDQVCTSTKDGIMKVLRAVMGVPGSSEADIPWAMKMKDGEDTGYVHAISYLFGNGQWLLDHPTDGLTDIFDEFENHMKQGMIWQLLRLQHHAVMVINDASPCEDVNEIRDDENGYCYGLMYLNDQLDNLEGGLNDVSAPLWDTYGLDKLATYRNTLDCWLSNDASVGAIEPNEDPSSTEYPKCFFGMEVKKGSWKDLSNGRHRIELDQDFPNGTGDDLE